MEVYFRCWRLSSRRLGWFQEGRGRGKVIRLYFMAQCIFTIIFLFWKWFLQVRGVQVVLVRSGLSPASFVNPFDLVQKSNNIFGQSYVFLGLLFGSFIFVQGQNKKSIFEVLGSVWLIIFPFAIASKLCLKNFHNQVDVIELDLFFFLVENSSNELVHLPGSSPQFWIKMIFNVVVWSIWHFLSNAWPFVSYFTVEFKQF